VCDLETSRMGAPYIYDISRLRVKHGVSDGDSIQTKPDGHLETLASGIKII